MESYVLRCSAVITRSIFTTILTTHNPHLAREGVLWMYFVSSVSDLCFAAVIAVLYAQPLVSETGIFRYNYTNSTDTDDMAPLVTSGLFY